ncbi:MAG: HutD family protein [Rhodoferax sp.]
MTSNLADGLKRFSLDELAQEPWRNGCGITRRLIGHDVDSKPLWRISVADITGNAPFSRFDGLDRQAVLVAGRNVTLCGDWGALAMNSVGDTARFPGELSVHTEIGCSLARFWNVMADRTRMRIDLRVSSSPQESLVAVGDGALMVMDGEAEVFLGDQPCATLRKDEGLLFDGFGDQLSLRFQEGACHWLLTTLKKR